MILSYEDKVKECIEKGVPIQAASQPPISVERSKVEDKPRVIEINQQQELPKKEKKSKR